VAGTLHRSHPDDLTEQLPMIYGSTLMSSSGEAIAECLIGDTEYVPVSVVNDDDVGSS
jgi:hypothetical protein